jgi:hypothetical protein
LEQACRSSFYWTPSQSAGVDGVSIKPSDKWTSLWNCILNFCNVSPDGASLSGRPLVPPSLLEQNPQYFLISSYNSPSSGIEKNSTFCYP